jgi:5S rRNA maturation endonuclease (ribonuclease M5)
MTVLDRVRDKLDIRNGMAKCPAHDDSSPSLSVGEGDDGRVLLHCHAGCTHDQIVAAVGLTVADLFPPKERSERRRIVATYPYHDADGTVVYEVVRYEPKDFRQRRPDGRGGFVYKLEGVDRVLYRLPAVLAAVKAGELVYIVEGEKDADALAAVGVCATTAPQGAGSWRHVARHAASVLEGAHVVVVPDQDAKGHGHAVDIVRSITGSAQSITVARPVVGKDAAEHLGAGRTVTELEPVASNVVKAPQTLDDWMADEIPCGQIDQMENRGDRRAVMPDAMWEHRRLAHIRDAAWSRGRAPSAVLGCVIARVGAHLDHRYALPPIVGGIGSLNIGVALIAGTGGGKTSGDAVAAELVRLPHVAGDPPPRGVSLGSGEGVAEAYMGARPATDDEKAAGLAVRSQMREQMRWRELFIGDEGQAILEQAKRSGATLMPTLRSLLTGGTLGQQNAASDNRRMIQAHRYRAAVLLGFQTSTAVPLIDDAAGGTPGRFSFIAASCPSVPRAADRPDWPGVLEIEPIPTTWTKQLDQHPGGYLIPVCDTARHEVVEADWRRQTGADTVRAIDAHANLVRLRVAAILNIICHGVPEVTDETWALAGLIGEHSRSVVADIEAYARAEARDREHQAAERLAARAIHTEQRTGTWRTVETAKKIAAKARAQPGISRSDLYRALKRWRENFDEGLDHAIAERWVVEVTAPSHTGTATRSLHPGEVRP